MLLTQRDHLNRANYNLSVLEILNNSEGRTSDWQVVLCFYVAIQAIHCDLCQYEHLECSSHVDRNNLIEPRLEPEKWNLPSDEFISYNKLEGNSKISRYLEKVGSGNVQDEDYQYFGGKKLLQNLIFLDRILFHYAQKLSLQFKSINLSVICNVTLTYEFKILQVKVIRR